MAAFAFRNESTFRSRYDELWFVLTVETSLIDKDGRFVFFCP